MKIMTSLCLALFVFNLQAMPQVGKPLPTATLSGDLGGKVDGSGWNTEELKGKVQVIFYVDPDEKNTNNHVSECHCSRKI